MADQSILFLQAGNILYFQLGAIVIPLYPFTYTSDKEALKADKETNFFTGIGEWLWRRKIALADQADAAENKMAGRNLLEFLPADGKSASGNASELHCQRAA